MNKKVTIELTQKEYDELCQFWEKAKDTKQIIHTKTTTVEDYCKEIIVGFTKTPDITAADIDGMVESMSDFGGLDGLKEALTGFFTGKMKTEEKKPEPKKDEIPDDKKYKS